MEIIKHQEYYVKRLCLCGGVTGKSMLKVLESQIQLSAVKPEEYEQVVIEYHAAQYLDDFFPASYPIRFYSKDGLKELWLSGFGGISSGEKIEEALQVLRMMRFEIFQNEIENVQKAFMNGRIVSLTKLS